MISVGRVLHNKNYDIVGKHLLDFLQIVNNILDSVGHFISTKWKPVWEWLISMSKINIEFLLFSH